MVLTDFIRRADTLANYSVEALWKLFDGTPDAINIAHECVDRHAHGDGRTAISIAYADGNIHSLSFDELARASGRFANRLAEAGVAQGDRVAVMLDPSPAFYIALFGTLKAGASVVPLFTLFGPDAIAARMEDSRARLLITSPAKAADVGSFEGCAIWSVDDAFLSELELYPADFTVNTAGTDVAVFQYTSGTTRQMPAAVKMPHKSIVLTMLPGLYGVGLRPGDRLFCPSSPAWGHGLWQGTLAPLALGITTGTYSGRFDPVRMTEALEGLGVTNLTAAATHYRMIRTANALEGRHIPLKKLSFAGEPIDSETEAFLAREFGLRVCSIFGSTEVGAVLVHYPEAPDVADKPGSLGLPVPGVHMEVQREDGSRADPGEIGEIKIWRRGGWVTTRDLGKVDADGFYYHAGRADDVIVSAGWTLSAVEIENVMLRHPDIKEAAAIGVPDSVRGQVVKAFVVSARSGDEAFAEEIQNQVRAALGNHEYPRKLAFVSELPKTPAGKINRKILRDREVHAA
ncbi:MAG: AMP-binding protein [Sphingobium sp.]|nr:AMP-binding protein [Sphingobium sp.]